MVPKEESAVPTNGDEPNQDDELLRLLGARMLSDGDQTLADAEQTTADGDQTRAEHDQELSERDQASSDSDQRAADRDQARAERAAGDADRDPAAADYDDATAVRVEASAVRMATSAERARIAARRLGAAQARDVTALARDAAATERDQLAERLEAQAVTAGGDGDAERGLAAARDRAAADRARAAADRASAAADRMEAARDRGTAQAALRHAYHDELTGALRRDLGEIALQHEIDRAVRGDGRLVLAFVDVDRLKEVNDRDGHGAGDAVLRAVVAAMRSKLRSFDPIVRYGGDEFICALTATDPKEANERFARIKEVLAGEDEDRTISVGVAALQPGDTLGDLVARGDAALYETKRARR
jgi:diguanylate cyclase (GGDEF)-like protein